MRKVLAVVTAALCLLVGGSAIGGPDLSDGVSVLILLAEPYGANSMLWLHQFERLGWDVTLTGLKETVRNCSSLCSPIDVDATLDHLEGIDAFDAIAVSTTPGTFSYMPVPAADLRGSGAALSIVREANAANLTLYTSCAGLLVFGEAGILAGRTVVCHPRIHEDPVLIGADRIPGGQSQLPIIDGNLVTSTSGRFFAQEIPEAIARSLDRSGPMPGSLEEVRAVDLCLDRTVLEFPGPATSSWSLGAAGTEGILGLCPVEEGFVAVGYTSSAPGRSVDLLVIRCDQDGRMLWARAVGGPGRDYGQDVCRRQGGGIAVVGYTTSAGEGCEDIWLVALDIDGNVEWMRTFGAVGPDMGFGVAAMPDGGLAICGNTAEDTNTPSDLLVMRTDAFGQALWTSTIARPGMERGHAIARDASGNLFVTGGTTSGNAGNYDMLIVSLSPDGEVNWQSDYGFPQFDVGHDLVASSSGDIFVSGYGDQEGLDTNNVLVTRYTSTGDRCWARRIGQGRRFEYGDAILELDDGSLLVCGARTSGTAADLDLLLLRVTQDGVTLWEASLGDENTNEWASALCQLPSGRIIVAGHTLPGNAGSHDALFLIVDEDVQVAP
ncbi:hypothetical protein JW848_10265 [Candidatus Bipolaricaulota bacterium]|nr:hypothetical protein [Candidatus Bipolaricaulota bacterium]